MHLLEQREHLAMLGCIVYDGRKSTETTSIITTVHTLVKYEHVPCWQPKKSIHRLTRTVSAHLL